ncbi:MAG TPA: hypothetical protein VF039_08025 [Longimicrobiales bacterium]
MRNFHDEQGREWTATAREESTPRHHGRWHLAFHPAADASQLLPLPEIRWQTADSAARTLRTMSEFELLRRLEAARSRQGADALNRTA